MRYSLGFLITAFILAGCATTGSLPVAERSRTYAMPYDSTFEAIQMMVSFSQLPVEEANRESGRIVTGYSNNSTVEAAVVGRMRSSGSFQLYPEGPDSTYVLVMIRTESTNAFGASSPQTMLRNQARNQYTQTLDAIGRVLHIHRHGSLIDTLRANQER